MQFIDVRDLAGWMVRLVEGGQTGVYNATGPEQPLSMQQFLLACREVSGSDATFIWVSDEFLVENEVGAFREIPLWIPASEADSAGFSAFNCAKAVTAGLTFRPLTNTVRDTLDWAATRPDDHEWRAGLTTEREAELLEAWKRQAR